ncbi:DUF742 domain-containing protein [Streptomyces sp. NPDC056244]|uniref:DUF742 domain-containing protein n=1 Tax=Streptomyces sp. NPDC056244 TaxID=3345762 RepID=UPI0035D9D678
MSADTDTDTQPGTDEVTHLRPYAASGGRTEPRHTLRLDTELEAGSQSPDGVLSAELDTLLVLCRARPSTVTELAGTIRQPVLVTKILISDLLDSGLLLISLAPSPDHTDPSLLEAVLVGLHNLKIA